MTGRPPSGKYKIKDMIKIINEYTDYSGFPILKEVCFNNDWDYQYFMNLQAEHSELRKSVKRLLLKKEIVLEKGAHSGQLDRTMVIFTLKQPAHGWTDNQAAKADSETITAVEKVLTSIRKAAKESLNETN